MHQDIVEISRFRLADNPRKPSCASFLAERPSGGFLFLGAVADALGKEYRSARVSA